jgi:hypothetical protein
VGARCANSGECSSEEERKIGVWGETRVE